MRPRLGVSTLVADAAAWTAWRRRMLAGRPVDASLDDLAAIAAVLDR